MWDFLVRPGGGWVTEQSTKDSQGHDSQLCCLWYGLHPHKKTTLSFKELDSEGLGTHSWITSVCMDGRQAVARPQLGSSHRNQGGNQGCLSRSVLA